MPKTDASTEVITIRVSRETARRLTREARRQRRPRSVVARTILVEGLGDEPSDPLAEARRQSLLVRRRASEREAIRFITDFADLEGWETIGRAESTELDQVGRALQTWLSI